MNRHILLARALAVASAAAGAVTLVPGVLVGEPVMNGSARGTAIIGLAAATVLFVLAPASQRSLRIASVTTGLSAYLLYNAVMFAFATPFNRAFLLYEAMLGLALVSVLVLGTDVAGRVGVLAHRPPRWVAVYFWVTVALNASVWLATVVPAILDDRPLRALDGSGLTTNPVFVQDLAVWLPLMAGLGLGVWRARPPMVGWAAAAATYWVVEAVSVAVDQWLGHQADPDSVWASAAAVPMFAVVAVVGVVPLVALLGSLPRQGSDAAAGPGQRVPTRRPVSSSQDSRT